MSKKRGGQPRNRNAFKHGFYAKYFSPYERKALSDIPITDMTDQIRLLRVQVDRFMQAYTASLDKLSYEERLVGLRAITLAVERIASMERILASNAQDLNDYNEVMQIMDSMPD